MHYSTIEHLSFQNVHFLFFATFVDIFLIFCQIFYLYFSLFKVFEPEILPSGNRVGEAKKRSQNRWDEEEPDSFSQGYTVFVIGHEVWLFLIS